MPAAEDGWSWRLSRVSDLPGVRADLRRRLAEADTPIGAERADAVDDATDQLVLAFDEMSSNALRHGGGTVTSRVRRRGDAWLVEVCDSAGNAAPMPAVDRDPSQGGLGLYLIAELSLEHGWEARNDGKAVWAVIPWPRRGTPAG